MNDILEQALQAKEAMDEELLARGDPEGYDLHVNGIRRIHVKDDESCIIWNIKDGKMIKKYDREILNV